MIARGVLAIALVGGLGAAASAGPSGDAGMGIPDAMVPIGGDGGMPMLPDAFQPIGGDGGMPMLPDAFQPIGSDARDAMIPDAFEPFDGDGGTPPPPDGANPPPSDADPTVPDADPTAPDADPTAPDAPSGGGPDADGDLGLTNYYACGCNSDTGIATGAMILFVLFLPFRTRGAR